VPIVQAAPEPEVVDLNPRAVMGANEPPIEEQIAMEFREALLSERPDFLVRMESAVEAVGRAEVVDDETLGKAGDLAKILRACESYVAEVHKAVKEPHLARSRACDAEKNALTGKITVARSRLADVMNAFMAKREAERRAEEMRRAAEARAAAEAAAKAEREAREAELAAQRAMAEAANEAEREAAAARAAEAQREAEQRMADAALAAAPVGKAEPVRSDTGSTISGRTVWQAEVENYKQALKAVKSRTIQRSGRPIDAADPAVS
jgi:hypothetical protein